MARMQNPNLEILVLAVDQLGQLAEEMVFLGGCATGLLITDTAAPPIRVTRDVDAIVQVVSRADYYQLSEKLRAQGFTEDMSEDAASVPLPSGKYIRMVTGPFLDNKTRSLRWAGRWRLPDESRH